jgi:hypothetical protein
MACRPRTGAGAVALAGRDIGVQATKREQAKIAETNFLARLFFIIEL